MCDLTMERWHSTRLVIKRTRDSSRAVLKLSGELDLEAVPALEEELRSLDTTTATHYVIDLSGLEFMDSTGIAAIYRAQMSARSNGRTLSFRRGPTQVQRVLELTGVIELLVFED